MGQYVAQHVAEERAGEFVDPDRNHAILERTGPGIWSDSVHDYLRQVGWVSLYVHCVRDGGDACASHPHSVCSSTVACGT